MKNIRSTFIPMRFFTSFVFAKPLRNRLFCRIVFVWIVLTLALANSSRSESFKNKQFAVQTTENNSRSVFTINDNWRFLPDDLNGAEKAVTTDENWQKINLPHTWNATDAFDDVPGYRRGASWYRKNLSLASDLKNKRVFLYFEGANQTADVFVNERFVGQHIGGYTAFCFDVTDFVKFDAPNLLAVKVDNSFNADIPPLTADFNFYGGIYRDVWLIATGDVHFKTTDLASSGVQISTPAVSEKNATFNVRGTIVNASKNPHNLEIVNSLLDADGNEVASKSSKLRIAAANEAEFEQKSDSIFNQKLWSPDAPYLYTVKSSIEENGKILDEISNPLGFRWFSFDGEKGFSLNGKAVNLRGANRHQDYKNLGNALPDSFHIRDMELMKSAGYNFVRLAHYPQDPTILQAADRLGIMLWEEIPLVNYTTISRKFNENSTTMLREMIRQHRNHPSVIMWGYMNEIYLRVPKENAENIKIETVKLARELDKIAHEEDATRPTTIAFHGSEDYNKYGLGDIPNIIGWNLYSGWYSNVFEDFGKFLDEQHKRFPKRPLIVSEYGANSDLRLHSLNPRRFDSTAEYQRMFHESYLAQINVRPFISGTTLWNEFDFGAELRGENMPHVNNKGMFTYDRRPKDDHYFYKANLSKEPILHIAVRDWQNRAGVDLKPQKIDVYSNLAEIELFQNGVSLGRKNPDEIKKATWEATLRNGENSFVAKGFKNNAEIVDEAKIFYKLISVNSNEIAVNVGSNADFIDESKTIWIADQPYKQGGFGFVGDAAPIVYGSQNDRNILETEDDPLFQTTREKFSAYRFDVPAGVYEVEMKFAETKFDRAGQRVFDVFINSLKVIENLDLVKDIGAQRALTKTFQISATNGIVIDFKAIQGTPILSGVKIRRL